MVHLCRESPIVNRNSEDIVSSTSATEVLPLRTAVIYNPTSGSRHNRSGKSIRAIAKVFQNAGHQITLIATEYVGHATVLAGEAAPCHDLILSAGGDGTAHEILQSLVKTASPCSLGVLPFGTANVLSADISLPLEPVAAAHALLRYKPRRISAGRMEFTDRFGDTRSRYFAVAAGLGAHAGLIYAASAKAKRRGGRFVYYYTGLQSLITHRFAPVRAVIAKANGEVIERTAVEAVAMRVSSFGGMLKRWRPGGALTSDELCLILLTRGDRGALFRYALAAFAGSAQQSAGIEFHFATHCRFETLPDHPATAPASKCIQIQLDGEIVCATPMSMCVVPNAFSLLMQPR